MKEHKIAIALAIVAVLLLPSIATMTAQGVSEEKWSMDSTPVVDIQFSDRPVKVLGKSQISASIEKGLKYGTSKVQALDSAEQISSITSEDILIIDALWLSTVSTKEIAPSVRDLILKGIPVVIVGGPANLIQKALDGTMVDCPFPESYQTAGLIYYPSSGLWASISLMGGPEELQEKWMVEGVAAAYDWCVKKMDLRQAEALKAEQMALLSGAYWTCIRELLWASQDAYIPYGRMNFVIRVYKLINDGNSNYAWFDIENNFETVPGAVAYSNTWRNADQDNYQDIDARSGHANDELVDYDPTSTSGSSTTVVNIGVTAGSQGASVTASISWMYSTVDVPVTCRCDMSIENAN